MSRARAPSLRARLGAAVVGLVAIAVAGAALAMYVGVRRATWAQHDRALVARAVALATLVEHDDEDGYEIEMPGATAGADDYFEVWLPDGRVLGRSPSLGERDLAIPAGALDRPRLVDVRLPDGRPGRAAAVRFVPRDESAGGAPGPVTLVVAGDIEQVESTLASVRRWFAAVAIAALIAAGLLAGWLVARGLRPLPRLAGAIAAIDDRRLSDRLPLDGQPRELQVPVRTLNQLLARLEESFARERRFTADVSHELRTPLAGLRTLLEVTATRDRSGDDYRAALARARAIVIELARLVDDLLTLARLDAGAAAARREPVDLAELVATAWLPHAARAAARDVELRVEVAPGTVIDTDPDRLAVVVGNLLGNAADYTEPGGWIAIRTDPPAVVLDVVDSGPPLPPEHLARVFDRFWRAESSRTGAGHAGIGLALARAHCRDLGLELSAATLDGGQVRFRIAAPGAPAAPGVRSGSAAA